MSDEEFLLQLARREGAEQFPVLVMSGFPKIEPKTISRSLAHDSEPVRLPGTRSDSRRSLL